MSHRPRIIRGATMASLATLLVASACSRNPKPDDVDPEDKIEFQCELGVLDADGVFIPGSASTPVELDLGFQGFLSVTTHVRATGEVPRVVSVTISATVTGEEPTGDTVPLLAMNSESEGKVLSDALLIFFNNDTPTDLEQRGLELSLRLDNATHVCWVDAPFLMVDDDPCIHTGDEPICPEDTTGTGGSSTSTSTSTSSGGGRGRSPR